MDILQVNNFHYLRGGSERYYLNVNSLLRKYGNNVLVFSSEHKKNIIPAESYTFVKTSDIENPGILDGVRYLFSFRSAEEMKKLLKKKRPDIAHLHIYYGKITPSILTPLRTAGIPIIQTLHEFKLACPINMLYSQGQVCQDCRGREFWRVSLKKCNRGSRARSFVNMIEAYISRALGAVSKIDHFITVSNFMRDKMIEVGIPSEKLTTVHHFIDASHITPTTKEGTHFLFLGRLERYKGIFTVLEAVETLKDTPLLIAGEGSARPEIESFIRQKGLNHVRLLGFKQGKELDDLIRNSICLIAPSELYESFGLVIIEAFAHGRPVIASQIGGMTEVVSEGRDGFLVSPGNVEQLRERMDWMAQHSDQAVQMGLSGRRKVDTQFSPRGHYEKLMAVYRKVLN